MHNFVEINIIAWYNTMYEIENIGYFPNIILIGADYGIQPAMKNRANFSIIVIKLSISYLNPLNQPAKTQLRILPANAYLLFLKLLLLFFSLAPVLKIPEWISNQEFFLIMRVVAVYGPTQRHCIAVLLLKRAPKFPGRYFRTSWVMP